MSEVIKCLAIGDPHFQTNNVKDILEFIERVVQVAVENSPDFIIVLGDLLHTHERIHTIPLKLATKLLKKLSKISPTFLIIGNHDLINNQQFLTSNHAFNAL